MCKWLEHYDNDVDDAEWSEVTLASPPKFPVHHVIPLKTYRKILSPKTCNSKRSA